jgi:hypothetical protein
VLGFRALGFRALGFRALGFMGMAISAARLMGTDTEGESRFRIRGIGLGLTTVIRRSTIAPPFGISHFRDRSIQAGADFLTTPISSRTSPECGQASSAFFRSTRSRRAVREDIPHSLTLTLIPHQRYCCSH